MSPNPSIKTTLVNTMNELQDLRKTLDQADLIAIDTETTNTDVMRADLVGISLAVETGQGYYIPVGHIKDQQLSLKDVFEVLAPPLTNAQIGKAGEYVRVIVRLYHLHQVLRNAI